MEQENWQKVERIFADALQQKPFERPQFLDRACRADKLLRREVESLLSSLDSAENFMESPAVGELADDFLMKSRKFAKGEFLGHYEIIRQIGTGGMGDVFLARDAKLHRPVALKILRADPSPEGVEKQRLLREARAAARLDHPNICAVYEISETDNCSFIVMQYVEGETLAEILAGGERPSVEKSLDWAIQIADALEEARSRQIVHRDIKPSNIVINRKGQLKVLDFGLAKFIEAETGAETARRLSGSGAIMGTVPYMSPEQLRGRRLDERSDIFSFGAVFYEMLTGLAPYQKESNAETISAILNDEPDWTHIPPELRPVVQKSLMKDKNERYQTAKDLAEDLRDLRQNADFIETGDKFGNRIFPRRTARRKARASGYYFWESSGSGDGVTPRTNPITDERKTTLEKSKPNYRTVFFVGFALFIVAGTMTWLVRQLPDKPGSHSFDDLRSVKLVSWKTGASSPYSSFRASHNGKMIAYSSTQEGENEGIYIKQTTDGADFRVTRDEWVNHTPIWSPDDQRLAFASFREGRSGIYVCPALGGRTTLLKVVGEGNISLNYWSKDGATIFYQTDGNLFRLDLTTQETARITDSDSSAKKYFSVSPDEQRIVYTDKSGEQTDLWTMPMTGGAPVRLTNDRDGEIQPRWHADGERILYTVYRNNHYQINLVRAGGGTPEQVTRGESEFELIDVSSDGAKIFYLSWEDKSDVWGVKVETGEEFEVAGDTASEFWSDISPDGKSILFQSNSSPYPIAAMNESSIIIKSLSNQTPEISLKGYNPRWLPDSRRVAFLRFAETEKKYALWTFNVINGEEKQITDNSAQSPSHAILPNNRGETDEFSWSPDSRQIVYLSKESQKRNVLTTAPETGQTINLTNNDNPNLVFYSPKWSLDGNLISYASSQNTASKDEKPLRKIWLIKNEKPKEIYSTTASLRILGWSAGGELFLETTDGAMKSSPIDVELIKISASGGDSKIITTFKNIYATSMTLSADGKAVAFVSRQDDKDNIFTAAATGGEAKKMTANHNARLYFGSPAWSPDGKTIFFDKQEETNTISMFENFK